MPVDQQALREAIKSLRIRDVYFRDEQVRIAPNLTPGYWPDNGPLQFKMVTRVLRDFEVADSKEHYEAGEREHLVEIEFTGSVRCLAKTEADDESAEESELVSMEVSIGLLYEMTQPCLEEGLEEFIRMNVPYHAIPYWREHVHAVCSKRRLPPITVPMYSRAIGAREPEAVPRAPSE